MKGDVGLPGPRVSVRSLNHSCHTCRCSRSDLVSVKVQKPVIDSHLDVSPQGPEGKPGQPGTSVVCVFIKTHVFIVVLLC